MSLLSAGRLGVNVVYSRPDNIRKTHLWAHATALSHLSTYSQSLSGGAGHIT